MSKLETIKYQGNDYATVPVRIKEFRSTNPRSSIVTTPMPQADGSMIIQAHIVTDRSDESSADATGSARYSETEMKARKAYEKLETIATGRALSLLGYLNNGEVASTEEMAEFEGFKADKIAENIEKAKSVEELMQIFNKMTAAEKKLFTESLSIKKKELANDSANK